MNLDSTFVASASVIIAAIIPLYIYREKVFPFIYKSGNFNLFMENIRNYLKKEHPKIKFDYTSILKKIQDEKDIRIKETLVVEDMVNQFFNHKYIKRTQNPVAKEKLWSSYTELSKSTPKYPNDWSMRKELAYTRDNKKCNRCACELKLANTITSFVKSIEDNGGYNLENIIILCSDCNSIIHSKNPTSTIHNLALNDKLMKFVTS